jgi:uncharacterized protein (DUF362 family)
VSSKVAVLRTRPDTVVADYGRLMRLAGYAGVLPRDGELLLKLNLSWTKYFPACSTQPWQLDGVVRALLEDGYRPERIHPVENKTVVTNPRKGVVANKWGPILTRHGLPFIPLPEVEWIVHRFKSPLLKLNDIFPEGIEIPKMYVGASVLHLPTVKTHGHSVTTGAVKNAFGGLLKEVRHYAHEFIHEVLVDLLYMQRELHPAVFAVMDGTGQAPAPCSRERGTSSSRRPIPWRSTRWPRASWATTRWRSRISGWRTSAGSGLPTPVRSSWSATTSAP